MTGQHAPEQWNDYAARRTDLRTRAIVDQAIAVIPEIGLLQAAKFLSSMRVPQEVAMRALCYPQLRRSPLNAR